MVASEASSAASSQRSLRAIRNDPKSNATNRGSDPPRYERWSQSKFRTAKKPAIHPSQRIQTSAAAANDATTLIASRTVRSDTRVTVESAAIA
jgi:hypothetical protein